MQQNETNQEQVDIQKQVFQECRTMAEYALSNGLAVPVDVVETIAAAGQDPLPEATDAAKTGLDRLVSAHQTLSGLVKPALPRTILLLDREQKSNNIWGFLGPVSIIRQMMIAAFISTASFILIALSPDITVGAGDIFQSHGWPLLLNLLFYISAAGLGASFAALYKANSYITRGTFDPTYHTSYWIRFCLGLIAGLVLSVMVSDSALHGAEGQAGNALNAASSITANDFLNPAFLRPMLAMLGGFSADLLYTILNRLVETTASLFQGSTKNLLDMQRQEAEARLAANNIQSQIDLAAKLVKLQQDVGKGTNPADIQAKIDKLLNDVMPNTGSTGGS